MSGDKNEVREIYYEKVLVSTKKVGDWKEKMTRTAPLITGGNAGLLPSRFSVKRVAFAHERPHQSLELAATVARLHFFS
jgi:hypothetical protein